MTLDDLELHKFEFFREFLGISQILDATTAKRMKIDQVVSKSNWSNFGMLSRRAGLSAIAGLSCSTFFLITPGGNVI